MKVSEAATKLGNLEFYVDKMHFRNHVDAWCHKHMNPNDDPKLKKVNSQICEQTFRFINKFRNVKTMNNAHFSLYFIYILDIHNLNKTKSLQKIRPNYVPDISPIVNNSNIATNVMTALFDVHELGLHSLGKEFSFCVCIQSFITWRKNKRC